MISLAITWPFYTIIEFSIWCISSLISLICLTLRTVFSITAWTLGTIVSVLTLIIGTIFSILIWILETLYSVIYSLIAWIIYIVWNIAKGYFVYECINYIWFIYKCKTDE